MTVNMDEQRTDAAGQAVALGEGIIAELRRALEVEGLKSATTGKPTPPLPPRASGVQSVAEAVTIAKGTLAEYESILEEQRKQVETWLANKQATRSASVEERIAEIKAKLNQPE
jgi:hypothetical protein